MHKKLRTGIYHLRDLLTQRTPSKLMFIAHKKNSKMFESAEVFMHLKILLLIFKCFHCCLLNPLQRVIEAINSLRHEI